MQTMFAERVKEILSCGKIWREKQTICLSFPYFKHKMMIFYYEVALFQGETHYHGQVGAKGLSKLTMSHTKPQGIPGGSCERTLPTCGPSHI